MNAEPDELTPAPEPVRCFWIEHARGGFVVVNACGRHLTAPHRSYEAALVAARNVSPNGVYGGVIGGAK